MPPRGVYQARKKEKERSDRITSFVEKQTKQVQEKKEKERADRQNTIKGIGADYLRKTKQATAFIKQKKKEVNQLQNVSQSKPIVTKGKTKEQVISQIQDPSDVIRASRAISKANTNFLYDTSKKIALKELEEKRAKKINNAVVSTSNAKMSPPRKSRSGLTISGGKISTYSGGESGPKTTSNIYKDPNTGSTIATKEARTNVSQGKDYNIVASTASKSLLPKISAGDIIGQKPKPKTAGPKGFTQKSPTDFMQQQIDIVNNLDNPSMNKKDLITKQNIKDIPTLLSDLRKKKSKRNLGAGQFMTSLIRTLLG
jgi:hypothetical protein